MSRRQRRLVLFHERAAIAEFDGGLPRAFAEARAFVCCIAPAGAAAGSKLTFQSDHLMGAGQFASLSISSSEPFSD